MTKWQDSGAFCATNSDSDKPLAKSITSDVLEANETTLQSSDYAQNIIAATRVFMGLEQKVLKNDMALVKTICSN